MVGADRGREAGELGGFVGGVVENTVYATGGSRYFALSTASSVVAYLTEAGGRFLNNLQMWLMPQLSYVDVDPKHLATSSIMPPHKRNPATVEVMRARIGEAIALNRHVLHT